MKRDKGRKQEMGIGECDGARGDGRVSDAEIERGDGGALCPISQQQLEG